MRKLLFLQFSVFAVMVAALGMAAFGIMLWDFQSPGTFKGFGLIDGGMALDLLLLIAFGLQHSLMARKGFKALLRRLMPVELERSFYVMLSGFVLFTMALLWVPTSEPLYDLRGTWEGYCLNAGAALGIVVMGLASIGFDVLDLVGVRSVIRILRGAPPATEPMKTPFAYRIVRHPLYLGLLLLFWLTPAMTHDHLFFAEVMTAYILIGIQFEERDLIALYGESYRAYQRQVPMLLPFTKLRKKGK